MKIGDKGYTLQLKEDVGLVIVQVHRQQINFLGTYNDCSGFVQDAYPCQDD